MAGTAVMAMTAEQWTKRFLGANGTPDARRKNGAVRWRRGGGFWLVYLLLPLHDAWVHHEILTSLLATALLVAFVLAYLFVIPTAWFGMAGYRRSAAVVGLLLGLAIACAVFIGPNALTTFIYVAVATVVALPMRVALPITTALAIAAAFAPEHMRRWHVHGLQWGNGVGVALATFAIYGVTRLIRANHELGAAREEVATLAAEQERMRIARDLHDLLGHSLTTVTVKAALAQRLLDKDVAAARAEIAAVERLAREALGDVRNAVAGFREVRLATELATAREVLAAAGIEADIPTGVDHVPAELGGLFGWVVREGITNVVRHSRAQRVRIALAANAIEIVDDGRGATTHDSVGAAGSGLSGLAERAAAAGGRLAVGAVPVPGNSAVAGGFRLRVEIP